MEPISFTSDQFAPYLPDHCQVNPNVLGFELAQWLSQALLAYDLVTSYPQAEDWGWYLECKLGNRRYLICCSGSQTGTGEYEWHFFIERVRTFFKNSPTHDREMREVLATVSQCLTDQGIELDEE